MELVISKQLSLVFAELLFRMQLTPGIIIEERIHVFFTNTFKTDTLGL